VGEREDNHGPSPPPAISTVAPHFPLRVLPHLLAFSLLSSFPQLSPFFFHSPVSPPFSSAIFCSSLSSLFLPIFLYRCYFVLLLVVCACNQGFATFSSPYKLRLFSCTPHVRCNANCLLIWLAVIRGSFCCWGLWWAIS